MKNLFLVFSVIFISLSFIPNGQERQDEARKELQIGIEGMSLKMTNIPGWSKLENQNGKYWKQSDLTSKESYLPCCKDDGFEFIQTFKFSLESNKYYLFTIKYDNSRLRTFVFLNSDLQKLLDAINTSDGQSYNALPIQDCENFEDNAVKYFDPEEAIKDKSMIRYLILGKERFNTSCHGEYIFALNSQVIKGEKIVRFNLPSLRNGVLPPSDNYFELKKVDFEKLFTFLPFINENKRESIPSNDNDAYSESIKNAESAIKDGLLKGAIMYYKQAKLYNPEAELPDQKIKEIEELINQQKK